MEPTKYSNLYRSTGVFKYIYKEGNFEIGGRDCNDLKFKLAMKGIKLQEKTHEQNNNRTEEITEQLLSKKIQKRKIQEKNKNFNKKVIKPTQSKKHSNNPVPNKEPLKKDIDYISSEEDIGFGKIKYRDLKGGVFETWGPDNSKRAQKLRKELIK